MRSRLRTRMIAVGGTVALAMSFTATVALAESGDKSTGGVGFTTMAGGAADVSFNAHDTLTATETDKGHVNVRGVGVGDVFYKGTVDCYERLSANSARFSGVVTETNDPFMRRFFEVAVEDNGSPGSNGDRISQALYFNPASSGGSDCGDLTPTALVERGNLVVHHKPL